MKRILFCILLTICSISLFAQQSNTEQEVDESIKQQARHIVDAFTTHLENIANKSIPDSIKDYHLEAALELFVGRGEGLVDSDGNHIIAPSRVVVSDKRIHYSNDYLMLIKPYLKRLKSFTHSKIRVKEVDICILQYSPINKDGICQAIVEIRHYVFKNQVVCDYTTIKRMAFNINSRAISTTRYNVYIGNIHVIEGDEDL